MWINLFNKWLVFIITTSLMTVIVFGSTLYAGDVENNLVIDTTAEDNTSIITFGYTDITVQEAWDMLSDTSDGIQIPIDVRSFEEWYEKRIDTPYPEHPRLYSLPDLRNENGLQQFMSLYDGSEVVVYCLSGGRSAIAAQILVDNDFNGKIYNMLGGISAWIVAGLPTKYDNQPPNQPDTPSGPTIGNPGVSYTFFSKTTDPDGDHIFYRFDWDDGTNSKWIGPYESGRIAAASHAWMIQGSYAIRVQARDEHFAVSEWSDPYAINMPKNKLLSRYPLFLLLFKFLEQHPHMFPILRLLLGL